MLCAVRNSPCSPLLPGYRNVPPGELEQRVYEIYRKR